jgi:hypothetical protein
MNSILINSIRPIRPIRPITKPVGEYLVLYASGGCGSFVKTIIYYYLTKLGKWNGYVFLKTNSHGNCHETLSHPLKSTCHCIFDIRACTMLNSDAKIVFITHDPDDIDIMLKLVYRKFTRHQPPSTIFLPKNYFKQLLDDMGSLPLDFFTNDLETIYYKIVKLSLDDWLNQNSPQLTDRDIEISFKTVLGKNDKDLHQIILDYLGVLERDAKVDSFINDYRTMTLNILNENS